MTVTQAEQEAPTRGQHSTTSPGRPSGSAGGAGATRASSARSASRAPRGPRSARLLLRRIEPLSVLKLSLTLSVAAVVAALVVVTILYGVLDAMGVFDTVGTFSNDIGATSSPKLVHFSTVIGWTAVVSAVLALFCSALATVATYVYNLVNEFVGGPEITFTERS